MSRPPDIPTGPGTPFGGGFYAGRIAVAGAAFALIVAPKALGERGDLAWSGQSLPSSRPLSLCDGMANSEVMATAGHPAARFCRSLTLGGAGDWYLPARDELELLYRHLKPGPTPNYTYASRAEWWNPEPGQFNGVDHNGNGGNRASLPAGRRYTTKIPGQTLAEAFRAGGAEAFEPRWYWSSSEFSPVFAWMQSFDHGLQSYGDTGDGHCCRAVRKVPIPHGLSAISARTTVRPILKA